MDSFRSTGHGRDGFSFARASAQKKQMHKAAQVCRQVQRTLSMVLGGECGDEMLQSCFVESVEPAPDVSRLLVTLIASNSDAMEVRRRLETITPWLRREVTAALSRKRSPELSFRVICNGEVR